MFFAMQMQRKPVFMKYCQNPRAVHMLCLLLPSGLMLSLRNKQLHCELVIPRDTIDVYRHRKSTTGALTSTFLSNVTMESLKMLTVLTNAM